MAETEEIITRYKADVNDQLRGIDQLIKENDKLSKQDNERVSDANKVNTSLATSAQKRLQLLKQEEAELKKLETARKAAFLPKDIDTFNQKIAQSKRNIDLLKGGTGEVNQLLSGLKGNLLGIASGIAAAFSVGAISAFAASSVEAFKEAEVNANRLKFAVTSVGGEGEQAFERLIKQSERLQAISVFSDDDIQKTQIQLKNFGLLGTEIESLTPLIIDLATASGKTLGEATDLVVQGINGQTRALKPLGIAFKDTGDRAENLNIITEKLTKFQGASAEALKTTAGEAANAANRFDDLQERFGELIATSSAFKGARQLISDFIDSFTSLEELRAKSKATSVTQVETAIVSGLEERLKIVKLTEENLKQIGLTEEQVKKVSTNEQLTNSAKEYILLQQDIIKNTKETAVQQKVLEELTVTLFNPDDAAQQREIASRRARKNALIEEAQALLNLIAIRKGELTGNQTRLGKTDEQLAKEASEAEQRLNKAREDAEKKRLQALADEKKVLAEIEKIKNSQLKDPVEQLEAQAKIDIQQIEETKATQTTKDEFVKERTIKLYNDILTITKEADEKLFSEALESAIKIQDISSKDSVESLKERRRIEVETVELTNRQKLSVLKEGSIEFINEEKRQLNETRIESLSNIDRTITDEQDAANQKLKINLDYADAIKELNKEITQSYIQSFKDSSQAIVALADIATEAANDSINLTIDSIRERQDAQNAALDTELKNLQDNRAKKLVTESTYQSQIEGIEKRRETLNREAENKIKAQQLKAAKIAKTLAIFKISLALATAIAEENYVGAVIAAAELAATIAKPLPAFRKGTKGKAESGVGLVGEEGAEFRYLEKDTQIVPARQTKTYKPLVNAMIDGNAEQYIFSNYVLPQLKAEKQKAAVIQQQSFAENIVNSMVYNTQTTADGGMNEYAWKRVMKDGTTIRNANELGAAIARNINKDRDYRFM